MDNCCKNSLSGSKKPRNSRWKYQDENGTSSCKICPSGNFQDELGAEQCIVCPAGYVSESGSSNCFPCSLGLFQSLAGQGDCDLCPPGRYQDEKGSPVCKVCPSGTFHEHFGKAHVENCTNCPVGYFSDSGSANCTACSAGQYQGSRGEASCNDCPPGQYQDEMGRTGCKLCLSGTFQGEYGMNHSDSCEECPAGYVSGNDSAICTLCLPGRYQSKHGESRCHSCNPGQYQDLEGQTSCSNCSSGEYQESIGGDSCTMCPPGTFLSMPGQSDIKSCEDCPKGYFSSHGSGECTLCETGDYQDTVGQSTCHSCPAGTYQDSIGKTSADDCIMCPIGSISSVGSKYCTPCSLGQFQNETGATLCHNCSAGQYQNVTGERDCKACPAGRYQGESGLESERSCEECLAGYFSGSGSKYCSSCFPGQHQNQTGETFCHSCDIGQYQELNGARDCRYCPSGTYQDEIGRSSCKMCPSGQIQESLGSSDCYEESENAQSAWGSLESADISVSILLPILVVVMMALYIRHRRRQNRGKRTKGSDDLKSQYARHFGLINVNSSSTSRETVFEPESKAVNPLLRRSIPKAEAQHGETSVVPVCTANQLAQSGSSASCSPALPFDLVEMKNLDPATRSQVKVASAKAPDLRTIHSSSSISQKTIVAMASEVDTSQMGTLDKARLSARRWKATLLAEPPPLVQVSLPEKQSDGAYGNKENLHTQFYRNPLLGDKESKTLASRLEFSKGSNDRRTHRKGQVLKRDAIGSTANTRQTSPLKSRKKEFVARPRN